MNILPDTRDLIDLTEHAHPIDAARFSEYLINRNHQIILSFTNIRELSGPLAVDGDFLRVRRLLQIVEAMPHTYLQEPTIPKKEIQSAVDAFVGGKEYEDISPYVARWDRTLSLLPGQIRTPYDMLVGLRLDDLVYDVFRHQPQVFSPPNQHLPRLVAQLAGDREALRSGKAPARQHFIGTVKRNAERHGVQLPQGREDELAEWIYANPARCPGLRLNHETYRQLMSNYEDVPEVGDFSDLAHVSAVPYVEVATLDNRMREYCSRAARRLVRVGLAVDYRERLYRDLASLIDKNP